MKSIDELLGKDMQKGALFRSTSKDFDVTIAKENLEKVLKAFKQYDVDYWLIFGTLLGCIRDKAFISYDTDIDIACYRSQYKQIAEAIRLLEQEEFQLIRCFPQNELVTIIRKKIYVDFYLWEKREEYYHYIGNQYLYKEDVKVKTVSFLGMEVCIPIVAEELIKLWYGKDWNIPIKNIVGISIDKRK